MLRVLPVSSATWRPLYEAADEEGAIWRAFVDLWWNRFGEQRVSAADLYKPALQCSVPLPSGDEHAKRTGLGQALKGMWDRIYTVRGRRLRVCHAGSAHGVQRWRLEIFTPSGGGSSLSGRHGGLVPGSNSPSAGGPPQKPTGGPPGRTVENQCSGGPGGPGGPLYTLTRVRAHSAREESREKAHQPHQAHPAQEIRGFRRWASGLASERRPSRGPTATGGS